MSADSKVGRSWLWPDAQISKARSGELRREHNALVESHAMLLEACQKIMVSQRPEAWDAVRKALAHAERE